MDRAPDRLPTTATGEPVATVPSGPIPITATDTSRDIAAEADAANQNGINGAPGVRFEVPQPSSDSEEEEEEEEEEDEGEAEEEEEEESDGMDVDDAELHPASVRV
jgi:hypothetical protein